MLRKIFWLALLMLLASGCAQPTISEGDSRLSSANGLLYCGSEPFSGSIRSEDTQGNLVAIEHYRAGKKHGVAKCWYADGRLAERRPYCDGEKTGWHCAWYPSGQRRFRYHFSHNQNDGDFWEWYDTGRPYRFRQFKAGLEIGQKIWRRDGQIYANYVHQDHQLAGLLGGRLCDATQLGP